MNNEDEQRKYACRQIKQTAANRYKKKKFFLYILLCIVACDVCEEVITLAYERG